nr:ABC transporter permease [Bacillota bacterium]
MIKITKKAALPKKQEAVIQVIAILLSLACAGIVILAMGYDPLEAYYRIVEGSIGSVMRIEQTITKSIPLI